MISGSLIPVTDPFAQLDALKPEIDEAINRVLRSGYYILGPEVEAFENEFAEYIGTDYAVGVANGTDALALALRALDIGPGDEVITVSHTAVATVAAIEQAGATPVLVDVEPDFLTLNPSQLEQVLSSRTKAVVPVHLYGQAADLVRIEAFCQNHDLALVEDVSQAHGAELNGKKLGSFGDISIFSCYPTKNLGALGDAGMAVTSDEHLAERLRRLRQYGWEQRNSSIEKGVNSRLDEIQAAVLRVKLLHLDSNNEARISIATAYNKALSKFDIGLPTVRSKSHHVFHLYVAQVENREAFRNLLSDQGIDTAIHYPTPVHQQQAYRGRIRTSEKMRVTEHAARNIVSMPIYPEMTPAQVSTVCTATARALS